MPPMLLIAVVATWILRHWWDGRRNDHNNPGNGYRSNVRNAAVRGANRRYTAGWTAYQLRHGWGPMKQDVVDGWHGARKAADEWRIDGSKRPPGFWEAVKDGWRGGEIPDPNAKPAVPQPTGDPGPTTPTTPATPSPAAPQMPTIVVINNPPGGQTVTTPTVNAGEMNSLDAYRRLLQETVNAATHRIETASHDVAAAERDISVYDTAQAQLNAPEVGLGPQTTGGLADLLEAAQERKRGAEATRIRAEQELVTAQNLLAALGSTGQDTMQEARAAATEAARDTNFYVPQ